MNDELIIRSLNKRPTVAFNSAISQYQKLVRNYKTWSCMIFCDNIFRGGKMKRLLFISICCTCLTSGCSEESTNPPSQSSNITNVVYGNCNVAPRKNTALDSNFAMLEQINSDTRITIPSAYHICKGTGTLSAIAIGDTLSIISTQGDVVSTCICKSEITFSLMETLPESVAWLKFDGQVFILKKRDNS